MLRKTACLLGDLQSCEAYGEADLGLLANARATECLAASDDSSVAKICSDAGLAYLDGIGVSVDRSRAEPLLRRACKGGAIEACDVFEPRR